MKADHHPSQWDVDLPDCVTCCLQAEASSRAEQLRDTREQLAETLAAYERHVIEAEARSKSEAADAVKQKSEELMQLKGSLDRYTAP